MAQIINTNIQSLNSQRNLNTSQSSLSMALQRLSSGLRINSAKDDAAGLAISDRMTSQIRGLNQAVRNANDGISLAQTAESALSEVGNLLQRMRELSIQSANATNSDSDRLSIQSEVSQLKQELTRIANNTTFNGQKILNGSQQNIAFHVGAEANQTIGISIGDSRSTSIGRNVIFANNTTNGLTKATSYNRFATEGTTVGNAVASATDNGVTAQNLTIRDASGNPTAGGVIAVAANEQASVTAARLNRIEGVQATAYNQMKLANWVANGTDSVSVVVSSGTGNAGVTQTLSLAGVNSGSSQADVFSALSNAINGNASLSAAGVVSGLDNNGNLVLRNNTGANLAVTVNSASAPTVDVYGSTGAALAAVAVGTASVVGGQLNINLANGYTIESSVAKATGLFDAAASTIVTAKETNVGIANVLTGDTNTNEVGSFGTLVGKAVAAATNGYSTGNETLKIRDASGTVISGGTITVTANDSAKATVGQLNAIPGISATGSNFALVTAVAQAGAGTATLSVNGTDLGLTSLFSASDETILKEVATAINANKTLQADGFNAVITADGALKITNTSGADIHLTASAGLATVTMAGYDAASAAATGADVTVGGTFRVALPEGYTIESSLGKATGLFDASANATVKAMATGVNLGNSAAAQTLSINGPAGSAQVDVSRDDAADVIAARINAYTSSTGVTAAATTQAKLSGISAAGTVTFSLFGSNSSATTISASVTGSGTLADMSSLANAINAKSETTGIRATLADNNASILLSHDSGANIVIADFTHSAGSVPSSANISGTDASIQVTGLSKKVDASGSVTTVSTSATTLHYGGTTNTGNDSTVVGGSLEFSATGAFDVKSSVGGASVNLAGANSSLFSGFSDVTNASAFTSINGVDVSTVAGANNAIAVIDAALNQVNSIRSALGAVQNRMQTTISNLTAGSENITAARSRIQDADFAQETANLTRAQILQQAGVAMLAQANQLPQMVLSLLK